MTRLAWDNVEWDLQPDGTPGPGLVTEVEHVTVTSIIHDGHVTLAWSINLKGAPWPEVEQVAELVGQSIAAILGGISDVEPGA